MATYKMKSTQKGVLTGSVHPVTFHQGNTYEIDDNLAGEFKTLDAIEESSEEAVEPEVDATRTDIHENWLDTDRAVLRHGELTAEQVIAKDESPYSEGAIPAVQVEGKAEGDADAEGTVAEESEDGSSRGRKSK